MLSLVFILIFFSSALALLSPFLIGKAVDAIGLDKKVDFNFLELMIMILIAAFIVDAALTLLQGWLMAGVYAAGCEEIAQCTFCKAAKAPGCLF